MQKCWNNDSANCLEMFRDDVIFDIYYIKFCNIESKPVVKIQTNKLQQIFDLTIRLTYIAVNDMKRLPASVKRKYIASLGKLYTYVIYDISASKLNNNLRLGFKPSDFLLGDLKNIIVTEEFFRNHLFFVINRKSEQYVRTPYSNRVQNYIKASNIHRYIYMWNIISAYIRFQHAPLFIDEKTLKDKRGRELFAKVLSNVGQAQYEYGLGFERSNYPLYFLWMKEAVKNGIGKPYSISYGLLEHLDVDKRMAYRLYEELFDCGFTEIGYKLYISELQKTKPKEANIKKYTEACFASGGLMNYYHYAKERCFVLGEYADVVNHDEALKGFEKFFEVYDTTSDYDFEKIDLRSLVCYMYYAYAAELDIEDEASPDYMQALKYYKKALDSCDMFDDKIFSIAKEFCEGGGVKQNIEHGISLLHMLINKDSNSAKEYISILGDTLMKNRQYIYAEKCYKICCSFDREYCDKYIIAKMYRELEERCG